MTSDPRRLTQGFSRQCLAACMGPARAAAVLPAPDKSHEKISSQKKTTGSAAPCVVCRACGSSAAVRRVAVPYVFRYLATELAAMNIKTTLAIAP